MKMVPNMGVDCNLRVCKIGGILSQLRITYQ